MQQEQVKIESFYEYVHVNGQIITKPSIVVDMGGGPEVYFDSPFVKSWKLITKVKK